MRASWITRASQLFRTNCAQLILTRLTPLNFSELDSVSSVMRSPQLLASLSEGSGIRDPKITLTLLKFLRINPANIRLTLILFDF